MFNLTVQSLNNKTITVIDFANNSILADFNQSYPTELPYTNIMVKVQTGNTLTLPNLGHAVHQIPNDWIFFFIVFALIGCTIGLAWMFKRKV